MDQGQAWRSAHCGRVLTRRFVTESLLVLMRRLETEGKSRSEIAKLTGLTPATVTRQLGPIRQYGWRRMKIAAI